MSAEFKNGEQSPGRPETVSPATAIATSLPSSSPAAVAKMAQAGSPSSLTTSKLMVDYLASPSSYSPEQQRTVFSPTFQATQNSPPNVSRPVSAPYTRAFVVVNDSLEVGSVARSRRRPESAIPKSRSRQKKELELLAKGSLARETAMQGARAWGQKVLPSDPRRNLRDQKLLPLYAPSAAGFKRSIRIAKSQKFLDSIRGRSTGEKRRNLKALQSYMVGAGLGASITFVSYGR